MAARRGKLLGIELDDVSWHRTVRRQLAPGTTPDAVEIPQKHANALLRSVARLVADIPTGGTPLVVWQQGPDELLVDTASATLACSSGLVRIALKVDCDQLDGPATVGVPLAVGAPGRPSGLVMSTFTRADGPAVVVDLWSEALTAFAWETLLELARRLSAEVGRDTKGRALVPADISAASNRLIITPMARHDVTLADVTLVDVGTTGRR
jgi:hypothetical protein